MGSERRTEQEGQPFAVRFSGLVVLGCVFDSLGGVPVGPS